MFWPFFLAPLFQNEAEVESLAAGLRSKVTTTGDARSKVGHLCPCFGFIVDWFSPEEE